MYLLALFLLAGAATSALTGCGATDGILSQAQRNSQVTLTVTSGNLSHSVPFTLIVE
jgi:predicted component of type VI protein secretion system